MMNRRQLLGGAAFLFTFGLGEREAVAAAGRTIVYIGARNCGPCQSFEAYDWEKFTAGVKKNGYGVRTVKVQDLKHIREIDAWPADLRPLLAQFKSKRGTPRFLVVEGGRVTRNLFGGYQGRRLAGYGPP